MLIFSDSKEVRCWEECGKCMSVLRGRTLRNRVSCGSYKEQRRVETVHIAVLPFLLSPSRNTQNRGRAHGVLKTKSLYIRHFICTISGVHFRHAYYYR